MSALCDGSTNAVSLKPTARATSCMAAGSSAPASSTMPAGLPMPGRAEKASKWSTRTTTIRSPSRSRPRLRARASLREGLVHRRVDHVLEQGAIVPALLRILDHEHDEHLLLRIDPERRAGGSAPGILAHGPGRRGFPGRGAHRKAQAEAETGPGKVVGPRLDRAPEMVGGHVGHGPGTEDPLAVERAAVE